MKAWVLAVGRMGLGIALLGLTASVTHGQPAPKERAVRSGAACPKGQIVDPRGSGKCVTQVVCAPDQEDVLNRCLAKCPEGMTRDSVGKCQGCPKGQIEDPRGTRKCVPQVVCGPDQEDVLNKCFPKCPAGTERISDGRCRAPHVGG